VHLYDFEARGWALGRPGVKCREHQLTIGVLTFLLVARRVYSGFAGASTRGESARTETRWKIRIQGCAGIRRVRCAWDQAIGGTRVGQLLGSTALARQRQGLHHRRRRHLECQEVLWYNDCCRTVSGLACPLAALPSPGLQ